MKIFSLIIFSVFLFSLNDIGKAYGSSVKSINIKFENFGMSLRERECHYKVLPTSNGYIGKLATYDIQANVDALIEKGHIKKNFNKIEDKKLLDYIGNTKQTFEDFQIENEKVESFIEALNTTPMDELDVKQFNLSETWLKQISEDLIEDASKGFSPEDIPSLKTRKRELLKTLLDPKKVKKRIQTHYAHGWTHDDVRIKVSVVMNNGEKISLSSKDQHAYMVPFNIEKLGKQFKTYNIRIGQALEEMMNPKCSWFKRANPDFKKIYEKKVLYGFIEEFKQTLGSLKELGDQIKPISKNFVIANSRLYESNADDKSYDWTVGLRHKDWLPNLFVSFSTIYKQKRLDLDKFSFNKISKYIEDILSIGWLKEFIISHPFHEFFINFEDGVSITEKEYKEKLGELNNVLSYKEFYSKGPTYWEFLLLSANKYSVSDNGNKGNLVNLNGKSFQLKKFLTQPYSNKIISLDVYNDIFGDSFWLVYPDKAMTLKRFGGDQVLNWEASELNKIEAFGSYVSGTRISPFGKIIKTQKTK